MSRLSKRLQEIDAHQRRLGNEKAVAHHLGEAGDALEFAARVAAGAYAARDRSVDESDVFRLGYATACRELVCVLRHMRAGTHPTPRELTQARIDAAEECGEPRPAGELEPIAPPFDELAWLRGKVRELAGKALIAGEDDMARELEMAARGEEYT